MIKWKKKFEKHNNDRLKYKKFAMATHEFNMTTKNSNFMSSKMSAPKRMMSRQGANTFLNIDFNYIGNTNDVNNFNILICYRLTI